MPLLARCLPALLLLTLALPAQARLFGAEEEDKPRPLTLVAGIGSGGDRLVFVDNGGDLYAGGLFLIQAGWVFVGQRWELRLTGGYKGHSVVGINGNADFRRFPLDAVLFYKYRKHRFGLGATHHFAPRYSIEINGEDEQFFDFEDATGGVVQYDYWPRRSLGMGLQYVFIDYEPEDGSGELEGDSFSIMANFRF